MSVVLSSLAGAGWQFFDNNGVPLSGGLLYTYAAGTTTPLTTYTNSSGTIANSNPIVLDVSGRPPQEVWLNTVSYKFVLKTSGGVEIWTADNLNGADYVTIQAVFTQLALSSGSSNIGFIQAGTGAVARTVQSKERDWISVLDFGAVADGNFTPGGSPSGTDNLSAFTNALAAAVSTGISRVRAPGGFYYLSGKLTLPRSITLEGDGTSHLPIFTQQAIKRGTCLLINGAVSGDCLAFEENAGHSGLRDISIYNTNTNAIRSVVSVVGQLYPRMRNVEIASLRPTTGVGLYLAPSSTGALYETLWGDFSNVTVNITDIGIANECSVQWGLKIYGLGTSSVPNANVFTGGQFTGIYGALLMDGAVAGSGALSCVFQGVKFDLNYKSTDHYTPQYVALADGVFGWLTNTNCYIIPVVQLLRANSAAFHGCYFESAGQPATYNDGTHGSYTLLPVFWNAGGTQSIYTGVVDCNWNGTYVYDKGARALITPTTSGHRHDNRFTPFVQVKLTTGGGQSIPNITWTKVLFNNVAGGDSSELEWDATNYKAKIKSDGVYTINAQVSYDGWALGGGTFGTVRLNVDGLGSGTYSIAGDTSAASTVGTAITAQFSLSIQLFAGDTIWIETLHNKGSAATLFANDTYFSTVKV